MKTSHKSGWWQGSTCIQNHRLTIGRPPWSMPSNIWQIVAPLQCGKGLLKFNQMSVRKCHSVESDLQVCLLWCENMLCWTLCRQLMWSYQCISRIIASQFEVCTFQITNFQPSSHLWPKLSEIIHWSNISQPEAPLLGLLELFVRDLSPHMSLDPIGKDTIQLKESVKSVFKTQIKHVILKPR